MTTLLRTLSIHLPPRVFPNSSPSYDDDSCPFLPGGHCYLLIYFISMSCVKSPSLPASRLLPTLVREDGGPGMTSPPLETQHMFVEFLWTSLVFRTVKVRRPPSLLLYIFLMRDNKLRECPVKKRKKGRRKVYRGILGGLTLLCPVLPSLTSLRAPGLMGDTPAASSSLLRTGRPTLSAINLHHHHHHHALQPRPAGAVGSSLLPAPYCLFTDPPATLYTATDPRYSGRLFCLCITA